MEAKAEQLEARLRVLGQDRDQATARLNAILGKIEEVGAWIEWAKKEPPEVGKEEVR